MKSGKTHYLVLTVLVLALTVCGCKKEPADEPVAINDPLPNSEQTVDETRNPEQPIDETPAIDVSERIEMSILYAGRPGSDREKDFVKFLSKHFTKVETSDFAKFNGSQSDNYDGTILDYDGDGFKAPRPSISRKLSKPVITVGVVGAFVCGNLSLKTDYL